LTRSFWSFSPTWTVSYKGRSPHFVRATYLTADYADYADLKKNNPSNPLNPRFIVTRLNVRQLGIPKYFGPDIYN